MIIKFFLLIRYKSGLIAVLNVNVSNGRISMVHKLQGHSSEIHSLVWCPTPKEHIDFGKFQGLSEHSLLFRNFELNP